MSTQDDKSNNSSITEERKAKVRYKRADYLTHEEMDILTERLSNFNNSGGNPFSSIRCMYTEYNAQSNIEETEKGYNLTASVYMRGGGLDTREIIISCNDSKNEERSYGPFFTMKLNGDNVYGITTNLNMIELQMLKCCIDALVNATLPLYKSTPDREKNLFLPDEKTEHEEKAKSFSKFFEKDGCSVKRDEEGYTTVKNSQGETILATNILSD